MYGDEVHPRHEVALKQPRLSFRDRHEHDAELDMSVHLSPVDTSLPSSAKRYLCCSSSTMYLSFDPAQSDKARNEVSVLRSERLDANINSVIVRFGEALHEPLSSACCFFAL
jgi:hypothetical protein